MKPVVQLALRIGITASVMIAVGFALYTHQIFTPTMRAFQFLQAGITSGIAFGFLVYRRGMFLGAALLLWFTILNFATADGHSWIYILTAVYMIGTTIAVWMARQWGDHAGWTSPVLRIALTGVCFSVMNGVHIIVLGLIRSFSTLTDAEHWHIAFLNMQIGVVIGLAAGAGMELAEYVIAHWTPSVPTSDPHSNAGRA